MLSFLTKNYRLTDFFFGRICAIITQVDNLLALLWNFNHLSWRVCALYKHLRKWLPFQAQITEGTL